MKKKKLNRSHSRTTVFSDDVYGVSRTKHWTKINGHKINYIGEYAELWRVTYKPKWADKYPEWLCKILFWLFNHNILRKLEKHL